MRPLVLALSLLVSIPALAQQSPSALPSKGVTLADGTLRHAAVSTRDVSGVSASRVQTLQVPDGAWVYGISIGERADNPCYLSLWWADVDGGEMTLGLSEFNQCQNNPTNTSLTSVGMRTVADWDEYGEGVGPVATAIAAPWETYQNISAMFNGGTPRLPILLHETGLSALKSVQVCHRDANDELKGLSVRGVTLDLQGAGPRAETRPIREANGKWDSDGVYRPNCDDLRPVRACPAQKVIVGVEVHYDAGRNASIRGLAPICSYIEG